MADQIHEYAAHVRAADGTEYRVLAFAERRTDGMWVGWLEFVPVVGLKPALRTGDETVQAEREDVAYWASGLEPIYLDGALARAR